MRWIRRTGAFRCSCSTSAITPTKRNLQGQIRENQEKEKRQQQARRRNLKPRVRKMEGKKRRLAMKASPENCFRDANVTSSCLSALYIMQLRVAPRRTGRTQRHGSRCSWTSRDSTIRKCAYQ